MGEIGHNPEKQINKRQEYTQLMGGAPEALFVLSGNIVKKPNETYKSTTYADKDQHGLLGGKGRVIAAAELGKYFPNMKLVTTSHTQKDRPSEASIMEEELEKLGIPQEQILQENQSYSTHSELIEMVKFAKAHGWKHIAVVSNDYHIPRVETMFERLAELSNGTFSPQDMEDFRKATQVSFVRAEDVLPHRSGHYSNLLSVVHELPSYQQRVINEQKGVHDIQQKGYDTSPTRIRSTTVEGEEEKAA